MNIILDDEILPRVNRLLKLAQDADTIYLVTPYLKLNDRVRQAVEKAAQTRANLIVITRRNVADRSDDDIRWLLDKKVSVYNWRIPPREDLSFKI